jgi:hypothetical protein
MVGTASSRPETPRQDGTRTQEEGGAEPEVECDTFQGESDEREDADHGPEV